MKNTNGAFPLLFLQGHVLAAGFLLWAFQRMFLATSKRHIHYSRNDKTIVQERIIAGIVCTLQIGAGLNSMPLLNLIDKDVAELVSQYPIHGSQQDEAEPVVDNDLTDDKDANE